MNHEHTYAPAAPRRDWRPLAGLAAVVVAIVAIVVIVLSLSARLDPLDREVRQAQAWRDAAQAEQLQGVDMLVAAGWRVLPLLAAIGALSVGLLIAYRRYASVEIIKAGYVVKAMEAQRQNVPQSLHYAPHYSSRNDIQGLEGTHAPLLAPPAAAGTPTFAQLLDSGRIGKGNPLLLGYDVDAGGELVGSWLDLYSTAVSGMPGSGKTTSQRFLAAQTALHGAKFAICDPHAGAADDSLGATLAPLSAAFVCEPASSDKAILEVVRYVADVGRRRIAGKDSDTTPLILWVDELTSLLGRSSIAGPLAELLEAIAQEYRKRHVFVCASGQIWTAERTTSELRDSFASVLCHRMKRSQARLLLPTDEAAQVERLETGRAVLWRTSGATSTIAVPLTTAQDVQRVAGLLTDDAATIRLPRMPKGSQTEADCMPEWKPDGSQVVAVANQATSASVRAEAARAARMFFDGLDPAAIVLELRGIKSNEGRKYQQALAEVLGLIREGGRG